MNGLNTCVGYCSLTSSEELQHEQGWMVGTNAFLMVPIILYHLHKFGLLWYFQLTDCRTHSSLLTCLLFLSPFFHSFAPFLSTSSR